MTDSFRRKLNKGNQLVRTLNNVETMQISIVVKVIPGPQFHSDYRVLLLEIKHLMRYCQIIMNKMDMIFIFKFCGTS